MKTLNETGIVGRKKLSRNIKKLDHFMLWSYNQICKQHLCIKMQSHMEESVIY